MIGLGAAMLLNAVSPAYANVPNYGVSSCRPISDELGRQLEQRRDAVEKQKGYFKLSDWPCEDDAIRDAGRYSDVLSALGEPSFAVAANRRGYRERLRLLVLPHIDPGYVLRLDISTDGSAQVTVSEAKWTSRERESEPRLLRRWTVAVDPAKANEFVRDVLRSDVLRSRFQPDVEKQVLSSNNDSEDSICINFGGAMLERLDEFGHHSVAKTGCGQSEAIEPLINELHELARVEAMTLDPVR